MLRVIFTIALAALFLMTVGLGGAIAVPYNNPQAYYITLECENGDEIEVLVAGGNPAFLTQTERLVGKVFTFEILVDDEVVFEETHGDQGKKQGLQDRLNTCTTEIELSGDELAEIRELFDLSGNEDIKAVLTVQAFQTPARKF